MKQNASLATHTKEYALQHFTKIENSDDQQHGCCGYTRCQKLALIIVFDFGYLWQDLSNFVCQVRTIHCQPKISKRL
jgi:hypothetical protein